MKVRFLLAAALLPLSACNIKTLDEIADIQHGQAVILSVGKEETLCTVMFTFASPNSNATPPPIYFDNIRSFTGKWLMKKCTSIHAGDIVPTISVGNQSPKIDWNRV